MKKGFILSLAVVVLSSLGYYIYHANSSTKFYPKPTQETEVLDVEEDEERAQKRAEWWENLHKAAEGVDWRTIEYRNTVERLRNKKSSLLRNDDPDSFVNGTILGQWYERGSSNQSGSVHDTDYDAATDKIYLVSDGGSLFKGAPNGLSWEIINQDYKFSKGLLRIVPNGASKRIIALINKIPHYSDDDGLTWTSSTGIVKNDEWGGVTTGIILDDANKTIICLAKDSYWSDFKIKVSTNLGQSFTSIHTFSSHLGYDLSNVHGSNTALIAEQGDITKVYKYNLATNSITTVLTENSDFYGNARANITATTLASGDQRWYRFNDSNQVFYTDDNGTSWTQTGTMPESPWEVGIYVSKFDPNTLYMGAMECYRSPNNGTSWIKLNEWYDYYDFVNSAIHADIMYFNEFETTNGLEFALVSNHGGLSYSTNKLLTVNNIGLNGLNVSQFYDVRTSPFNTNYILAGTQDQGFQSMLTSDDTSVVNADQVISGDYGDIIFSNNNTGMWTVYPGGWYTHYTVNNTTLLNLSIDASHTISSNDENYWMPALMPSPNANEDAIYATGGSATGGIGSYIIKLTNDINGITATNLPFNFFLTSNNSVLSAIDWAPSATNRWYAATENGRFFSSDNSGLTWEQSLNFLPEAYYLSGQAIDVHPLDEDIVVFGGSGYSNPPVYISTDGGDNFSTLTTGLPSTLVLDMEFNDDGTLLFAATEAGPYVYDFNSESWYDLYSDNTPNQTYFSVEVLDDLNIVRYGTYGRGAWDFNITVNEDNTPITNIKDEDNIKIFPNPVVDILTIQLEEDKSHSLDLYNLNGQLVKSMTSDVRDNQMNLSALAKGQYTLVIKSKDQAWSKKIIKQ